MGDYFKPGRRKIGVVTLVTACVLSVIWTRSRSQADAIQLTSTYSSATLISGGGEFTILPGASRFNVFPETVEDSFGSRTTLVFVPAIQIGEDIPVFDWQSAAGSKVRVQSPQPGLKKVGMVSYWSIVIPLTLLSAYLLLSRPRAKPPVSVA